MEKDLENIFLTTIEANKDRIFRLCRSYSTDADDAKDLFQEVLINLWKSLPSFKHRSNIDIWVYRITINICLRAKQFSDKKQKHFVKLESINIENIADTNIPEENEKLFIKLSECIKKLEGVEKSIIMLHLEGLPYKEIARILGLCGNTGHSSEAHIHFHIQNVEDINQATGVKCYFNKIIVDGQLKNDYSPLKNETVSNVK